MVQKAERGCLGPPMTHPERPAPQARRNDRVRMQQGERGLPSCTERAAAAMGGTALPERTPTCPRAGRHRTSSVLRRKPTESTHQLRLTTKGQPSTGTGRPSAAVGTSPAMPHSIQGPRPGHGRPEAQSSAAGYRHRVGSHQVQRTGSAEHGRPKVDKPQSHNTEQQPDT